MPEKRRVFAKGEKTKMMNYSFYAVCTETTSWEQRVIVSVPEGTTDHQLEALGQVLVQNEDGVKELGFFERTNESEEHDIEIHESGHEDDGEESLPCRLNEEGEWEIGGIHWEDEARKPEKEDSRLGAGEEQEEHTAIRLIFERLAPVRGVVEVWVPSRLADKVDVGTHLAETLEDALLEGECVSWSDQADLGRAIRPPQLDSVEIVQNHEKDVTTTYRGVLKPTSGWKVMRLSSDDR